MAERSIYAPPRLVHDVSECYFYHTIELPRYGVMNGEWDLRPGIDAYLGNVSVARKRVLDIGTANGFLTFEMEKRGAEVVGYDLSEKEDWDLVPHGGSVPEELMQPRKQRIREINNAWWLTHQLIGSEAKGAYGTVYNLPPAIGPVDISVFGSILLHLRDPFLALQKAAAITQESIVVSDLMPQPPPRQKGLLARLCRRFVTVPEPEIQFVASAERPQMNDTWWTLTPGLVARWLQILGFSATRVSSHEQQFMHGPLSLFTVVATRESRAATA